MKFEKFVVVGIKLKGGGTKSSVLGRQVVGEFHFSSVVGSVRRNIT